MKSKENRKRIILAFCLIILFVIGISAKLYSGEGSRIISDKIAGSLYVIFWCFFLTLIYVRQSIVRLVIIVLTITCLLELLQLYTSPVLAAIRSTFLGRSLIGSSFSWSDFPYYLAGALLALYLLRLIEKKIKPELA